MFRCSINRPIVSRLGSAPMCRRCQLVAFAVTTAASHPTDRRHLAPPNACLPSPFSTTTELECRTPTCGRFPRLYLRDSLRERVRPPPAPSAHACGRFGWPQCAATRGLLRRNGTASRSTQETAEPGVTHRSAGRHSGMRVRPDREAGQRATSAPARLLHEPSPRLRPQPHRAPVSRLRCTIAAPPRMPPARSGFPAAPFPAISDRTANDPKTIRSSSARRCARC